jgi:pyroglutamyl-peptidase
MMKKILITGFEPFGGMLQNPSRLIVHAIHSQIINGCAVVGAELPVDYRALPPALLELLEREKPDVLLGLGLAAGRTSLSLERIGVNLLDFHEDNGGHSVQDVPIVENGPAAYFSTLPLRAIQNSLCEAAIPCYLSESAGLYMCNQLLYLGCHYAATAHRPIPVGFIHLPTLPEMVTEKSARNTATMPLELEIKGIRIALETISIFI